jgi:hypothetical protein
MKKIFIQKIIPVFLAVFTFLVLATTLYGILLLLTSLPLNYPIILDFRRREPLIGIAIYLKTAIDFAILMGNLMHTNPGWKKRVAIGLGTALGNAFGTFAMLTVWTLAKEFRILIVLFVFVSSVILLRLAEESLEEFLKQKKSFIKIDIRKPVSLLQEQLDFINKLFRPILRFFVTDLNLKKTQKLSFANLVIFSFTIPFILGFNDFSAYIPLFAYINVFGFTLGILLGHLLLTIGLFVFPKKTVVFVKHPLVLISGGLTFIAIALFGFYQAVQILTSII